MTNHVQILLYTSYLHIIGGIETFVMNWIELMSPYYSIGVAVDQLPDEMAERISAKVPLFTNRRPVACDTLIMIRVMDDIPQYVKYRKSFLRKLLKMTLRDVRRISLLKSNLLRRDMNWQKLLKMQEAKAGFH